MSGATGWAHRTVLVTGGTGFIGSHLAERLVELGARTRVLVHYNSAGTAGWLDHSPASADIERIPGDVCDPGTLRPALRGVDVVFHLAALIGIPYSYHAAASYVRTNVEGSLNVFQAALDAGVSRVVQTSTSEVYGTPSTLPIAETHPLRGQSPYAATKIGADMLAEAFWRSFGLPITVARPFNAYGPRQSARAVIPTVITQALTRAEIRLGHLDTTRDFTFVTDTVDGFVRLGSLEGVEGQIVNLGSGREISVRRLAEEVLSLVGRTVPIVTSIERERPDASEVERLRADVSRAAGLIGWQARTSLHDGLRTTIDWIASHIDRFRPDTYAI